MSAGQILAGLGVIWVLWKVFRGFLVKSPLDNIPGPTPTSWFKGRTPFCCHASPFLLIYYKCIGNLAQLLSRGGWDFMDEMVQKYGPGVVKFQTVLGVRSHRYVAVWRFWHYVPLEKKLVCLRPNCPSEHRYQGSAVLPAYSMEYRVSVFWDPWLELLLTIFRLSCSSFALTLGPGLLGVEGTYTSHPRIKYFLTYLICRGSSQETAQDGHPSFLD